jgi:hypothetical protein
MLVPLISRFEVDIIFVIVWVLPIGGHALVELISVFSEHDTLIYDGFQLFEGALHSVVHVTQNEVEVAKYIGVEFFTLDTHLLNDFRHHLIALDEIFSTMNQMHIDNIELVVIEFER